VKVGDDPTMEKRVSNGATRAEAPPPCVTVHEVIGQAADLELVKISELV